MFYQPATLSEALRVLRDSGPAPLAGGTDLYPAAVTRALPASVLDLSRVAGLRDIRVDRDIVRIGGGATWTDIIRADLPPAFAMLQTAARQVGSVQIQNRATLGGNLCNASPAADGVPPLLALNAAVELVSDAGRRIVSVESFVLGNRQTARKPDELVAAISIPRDIDRAGSAFVKLGARKYLVISIVSVAVALLIGDGVVRAARIAVGSASVVARRLRALEARLIGVSHDRVGSLVEPGDLSPLSPIDDLRSTAAYRLDAARELVGRALEEAARA